jgi:phage shock protein E
MNLKLIISFFALLMMTLSCGQVNSEPKISQAEIEVIASDPETIFVDVRTPQEFKEKTAEGAINIPLAKVEENLEFFRKQKKVVLFCNSGRQSGIALKTLEKNGINNAVNAKTVRNAESLNKK